MWSAHRRTTPPLAYQVFGAVMQTQGAEGTRALLKDQLEANSLRIVALHLVLPFSTAQPPLLFYRTVLSIMIFRDALQRNTCETALTSHH